MNDPCEHCMIKCSDIEEAITAGCDAVLVKHLRKENDKLKSKLKEASEFIQKIGPTIDYPIITEIEEVLK